MTNPDYTHLALIVDRSGSMQRLASDMEGSIKTLLAEQGALPGELHVDITTFDSEVETPYVDARVDDIKGQIIVPRGATALYDAVGATIVRLGERFAAMQEADRPGKVVVVIVTDGMENASREYTASAVKDLVSQQQNDYGWEFLFLGAPESDAFNQASNIGLGFAQTLSYAGTADGVTSAGHAASGYITRSRTGEKTEFTEEERQAAQAS